MISVLGDGLALELLVHNHHVLAALFLDEGRFLAIDLTYPDL